jgi:hypothetical protein
MLGEDAIECYGLNRPKVQSIADRIGHRPADILGEHLSSRVSLKIMTLEAAS